MKRTTRSGLTLLEVTIALVFLTTLMLFATVNLHREASALGAMARMSHIHGRAEIVVDQIRTELEYAQGLEPQGFIGTAVLAGTTDRLEVDTTRGFPNSGYLLLEPGTAGEERIAYTGLAAAPDAFVQLQRGLLCTVADNHAAGVLVRWGGMAIAIEDQTAPPVAFFDGIASETIGQVFFRGDGTGFSYQIPVDIAGDGSYFDANGEIQWGAVVNGVVTLDGTSCFYFEPAVVVTEVGRGGDLNRDGDRNDTFDLGRIRMRTWFVTNPDTLYSDVALGPPIVLQEQCNWGGDLDADGFEDPIFLWDGESGRLRLRLFILAEAADQMPHLRIVEAILFLRNGIDD